ncbi:LLM class flavin-dependent oxidoreductase [Amycolatopsis suaedae]|nr:LLM class flavin-dependent oxidoreductase [Amycolatopsis suaedae]
MRLSVVSGGFAPVADGVGLVELAESCGLDGVWLAEHVGFRDCVVPAAAGLARTSRVDVGVAGPAPASRHPGLLAMELASLAELGPGRVRAQVGLGGEPLVARLGGSHRDAVRTAREFVTVLRALLAGERVTGTFAGATFDGLRLAHAAPVALDLLAMRPRMLELAAEVADGVSLSAGASAAYLTRVVRSLRTSGGFRVTAMAVGAVAESERAALAAVEPAFRMLPPVLAEGAAGRRELAFVATPDTVADELARYAATGIDELALTLFGDPHHLPGTLRLLATHCP